MGIYRSRVQDLLVVPVSISLPRTQRGQGWPASRQKLVSLVVDSGSKYCSLTPDVFEELDLPFWRPVHVSTHLGEGSAGLYRASFAFPTSTLASFPAVTVARLRMPRHLASYEGVIGRDLLRAWETFYSGPRGQLTIGDYRSFWGWLFS
jgi:hypothetical protein